MLSGVIDCLRYSWIHFLVEWILSLHIEWCIITNKIFTNLIISLYSSTYNLSISLYVCNISEVVFKSVYLFRFSNKVFLIIPYSTIALFLSIIVYFIAHLLAIN